MKNIFKKYSIEELTQTIKNIISKHCLNMEKEDIYLVFNAIYKNPNLAPNIRKSDEKTYEEILYSWVKKFYNGYKNRISKRKSNYPSTVPDKIVYTIIKARLSKLNEIQLKTINDSHRLAMSSENILGLLLEEFLSIHLKKFGWQCAWGESIKSVDFVNKNFELLQIKNRSNSENSSSSKVREGTEIKKWFRVTAQTGDTQWCILNNMINESCELSEVLFENFIKETLRTNPEALAIEENNYWLNGK